MNGDRIAMVTESQKSVEERYSSYLQYLPGLYREHEFIGRFLCIFEDILQPIEGIVDNLPFYFDPGTAPESFLPWLASWIGLVLDERWPEDSRRQLIESAVELYRWRGTKHGLIKFLEVYTGVTPDIIEPGPIPPTGSKDTTQKPHTAQTEPVDMKPHCFTVVLNVGKTTDIDVDIIRTIIETQKPAHTAYILKMGK
jgi:phage tail-like protein